MIHVSMKTGRKDEMSLSPLYVLYRLSMDWMRLTHVMNGNLPDSEPTDLNINLILQNTLTATSRMFDQIGEHFMSQPGRHIRLSII